MGLETFFTIKEQTQLFMYSCILGAVLSIFFDIFRVIRAVLPHNVILTAIEDFVFMTACGLAMMVFSIVYARGDFRIFYIVGAAVGFTLWHITAGNIVLGVVRKSSELIRGAVIKIMRIPEKLISLICPKLHHKDWNLCKLSRNFKKN